MRSHMIERPFPCNICGKKFRQLQHLKDHKFTNSKIKLHICSLCRKGFCQEKNLNVHLEAVSPGKDGLARSCTVGYGIPRDVRDISKYKGRRWHTITHSAQRLSLLLSFEEQKEPLTEEGGNTISKSSAESEPGSEAVVELTLLTRLVMKVAAR